jgi:hypothetical protein
LLASERSDRYLSRLRESRNPQAPRAERDERLLRQLDTGLL